MSKSRFLFLLVFDISPGSTVHTRLKGPEPPPRQADCFFVFAGSPETHYFTIIVLFVDKKYKNELFEKSKNNLEKLGLVML